MNTKDALIGAKKVLEENYWIKGHYRDDLNGYCALGAVRKAVGFYDYPYTHDIENLYIECQRKLSECTPDHIHIVDYNDTVAQTKAEILAVFDCAIALQ